MLQLFPELWEGWPLRPHFQTRELGREEEKSWGGRREEGPRDPGYDLKVSFVLGFPPEKVNIALGLLE